MWNCIFALLIMVFAFAVAVRADGATGVFFLVCCLLCFLVGFKANYDMFAERAEKGLPFELSDKVYKIEPLDFGE